MESSTRVYPEAVVLPLLSILSIIIVIVPLTLHAKNNNRPASLILCWFILLNAFNVINAFLWPNDDIESWYDGAGLCDIESKVMIASYVAVPGALLCVFRSLARVLDTSCAAIVPSKSQRWRNRGMETLFCVVVPVVAMADHIVYQKSRYMIFSISGCVNDFDESPMSFALSFIWPPVLCLIASYYCGIVLFRLQKYRSQFSVVLNASNSNYNKSRFLRLFFLGFTMLLIILPVQCFVVYYNTMLSLPWHVYSWDRIHADSSSQWDTIIKTPTHGHVFFDRWVPIAASVLVFIFFGNGKDANDLYQSFLRTVGLGKWFGSLSSESSRRSSTAASTSSRVKLLFHKKWTSSSRFVLPCTIMYVLGANKNRTNVSNASQSSSDAEKGLARAIESRHGQPYHHGQKQSWYHIARSLLRSSRVPSGPHDRHHYFDHDGPSAPETTVHTNAWAGMSRSRASTELSPTVLSRKDFIRVRQEISQESEMQEIV